MIRLPAEAYATAAAYLSDTLDWLNQWHDVDSTGELDEDFHYPEPNHLFPHL